MQTQVKTDLDRKGRDLSFLVTVLRIPRELMSIGGAKLSLSKATRHCPLKPVLILAVDDDQRVIARASVPKVLEMVSINPGSSPFKFFFSVLPRYALSWSMFYNLTNSGLSWTWLIQFRNEHTSSSRYDSKKFRG